MENIKIRRLINPTPEEVNAAVEVWEKSFVDVLFDRSLVGGNFDYWHAFHHATMSAALVGGGEVWVAEDENGKVVAAAAWFGPGTGLMHTEEQGQAGFNALLESYPEELVTWWTTYFLPRYEKVTTDSLGEGVKLDAWHLQQISVLPELQRKGIARALIQAVENKPEASGKLFVLEVEEADKLPVYEKLGYAVIGKSDFKGSVPGTDFTVWVLRKQL